MYTAITHDLIRPLHVPKSKRRRQRCARVKQRLWSAAAYNHFGVTLGGGLDASSPFDVQPSWWQPEAEIICAADHSVCNETSLEYSMNFKSNDASYIPARELYVDVHSNLRQLDITLEQWLFGDGVVSSACGEMVTIPVNLEHINTYPVPDVVLSDSEEETFECDYMIALRSISSQQAKLLDALGQASAVAQQIENGEIVPYDVQGLEETDLRVVLMDIFRFKVPAGMAQRQAEDDEYDLHLEEEERDMNLAKLGHLFTYSRDQFWRELGTVSDDVKRDLVRFGITHPPLSVPKATSTAEFEELFHSDIRGAYAWQERYSDQDDDDDLLKLLKLLRAAIS